MSEPLYRPMNLAGLYWVERGRAASFGSSRPGYGVQSVATGEVLSSNGVQPSVWRTHATAATIAEYADDMSGVWVRVFGSAIEAALSCVPELDSGSANAARGQVR